MQTRDGRLEAILAWWHKDRDDLQAQTQPHHAADEIRMLVGSAEAGVVVKLGMARTAHRLPVGRQGRHDVGGPDARLWPGRRQPAMQRDSRQELNLRSSLDEQPFDQVNRIHVVRPRRHGRQIPASRRCRPARPTLPLHEVMAFQNAMAGAHGMPRSFSIRFAASY